MEELLKHPILTLTLSTTFNPQQWHRLAREPPPVYQAQMRAISQLLDRHLPQLTIAYYRFIQNQLTLNLWHKNQSQLRIVIQPYLFGQHPEPEVQPLRLKSTPVKIPCRTEPTAVRKYFAQSCGSVRLPSQADKEPINNHHLFMETFKACRGKKYVAYDYEKHMKYSKEKVKYNKFIRNSHSRKKSTPVAKQHSLQRFEEWELDKHHKTSLVNFRRILEDINLNNQKGLHKMLRKQGTQKLVLVNHQRKPINYYLSDNNRKTRKALYI